MANINTGTPRAMWSAVAGIRPPRDPKEKAALKSGAIFVNFADNVICFGTGGGGYREYSLTLTNVAPPNG